MATGGEGSPLADVAQPFQRTDYQPCAKFRVSEDCRRPDPDVEPVVLVERTFGVWKKNRFEARTTIFYGIRRIYDLWPFRLVNSIFVGKTDYIK